MNREKQKKARERCYLDRFKEEYPDFPQGAIKCSEAPDFLVLGSDQTIGIEIEGYVREQGTKGSPCDKRSTSRQKWHTKLEDSTSPAVVYP